MSEFLLACLRSKLFHESKWICAYVTDITLNWFKFKRVALYLQHSNVDIDQKLLVKLAFQVSQYIN